MIYPKKGKIMLLKNSTPGDIVNFVYIQPHSGVGKRHLAKVVSAKTFSKEETSFLNSKSEYRKKDPEFIRTETLVTCTLPGGESRNFYAERCESCVKPAMGEIMYAIKDMMARIRKW